MFLKPLDLNPNFWEDNTKMNDMKKDITWKSFRAYVNSNKTKRAFAVIYIALIYNYFF